MTKISAHCLQITLSMKLSILPTSLHLLLRTAAANNLDKDNNKAKVVVNSLDKEDSSKDKAANRRAAADQRLSNVVSNRTNLARLDSNREVKPSLVNLNLASRPSLVRPAAAVVDSLLTEEKEDSNSKAKASKWRR